MLTSTRCKIFLNWIFLSSKEASSELRWMFTIVFYARMEYDMFSRSLTPSFLIHRVHIQASKSCTEALQPQMSEEERDFAMTCCSIIHAVEIKPQWTCLWASSSFFRSCATEALNSEGKEKTEPQALLSHACFLGLVSIVSNALKIKIILKFLATVCI